MDIGNQEEEAEDEDEEEDYALYGPDLHDWGGATDLYEWMMDSGWRTTTGTKMGTTPKWLTCKAAFGERATYHQGGKGRGMPPAFRKNSWGKKGKSQGVDQR